MKIKLKVIGKPLCASCALSIEKVFRKGEINVDINLALGLLMFEFDSEVTSINKIQQQLIKLDVETAE